MPGLYRKGETYVCTIVTGPSHVFLGLRLSESAVQSIEFLKLQPSGSCSHGELDENEISNAISQAVEHAASEFGVEFFVKYIEYVANDSPGYETYQQAARCIFRGIIQKNEFKVINESDAT